MTDSQMQTDSDLVLVAEDNNFVRMQIVRYLEDAGYRVIEAANGDEARDKMDEPDLMLAIVDVRMEPVDGFEFIRTLRGMGQNIPVILVTGDSNPDLLSEASRWDVGAVLIKPVQKDRLVKAVEKAILSYRRRMA